MQKISTICSSYKSGEKIEVLLNSFNSQNYPYKELIIVEGSEIDLEYNLLLKRTKDIENVKIFYLENSSIYECLNYGIQKSSGEIINIMGDDDRYINKNLFNYIINNFSISLDYIYGDTIYEKKNKKTRYYKSYSLESKLIDIGYMPSHTSLFLKKKIYNIIGGYNVKYKIAGDLDFFFKLKNYSLNYLYLNEVITVMSQGGTSNKSLKNIFFSNTEAFKILKINNYKFIVLRLIVKLIFKLFLLVKFKYIKL
ncbi:glycosyltransferase [Candidatus Pelagibacter ubique]|jgi:glycosyltransferase|nr:glycosyltransferase [Candidatus Pelagibacter ubique]